MLDNNPLLIKEIICNSWLQCISFRLRTHKELITNLNTLPKSDIFEYHL